MTAQLLSERAQRTISVPLGDLVENANAQFYSYLQWLNSYFYRRHGFYRVAIVGAARLPDGHHALNWAYELGERLAQNGIDIVVRAGCENSVGFQAAAGHRAGRRGDPDARKMTTPRCINVGTQKLVPKEWRRGSGRIFDESIETSNHFDMMGGLGSDFVALEGGPDVGEFIAGIWQRTQFQIKIPPDDVPLGLRLGTTVRRKHWTPRVVCLGGFEEWEYMHTAIRTFSETETINVERKEHEVVQFLPDADKVVRYAVLRRNTWNTHEIARSVPAIPDDFTALRANVSQSSIAKAARQQSRLYEELAASCIAPADEYYCSATYGSHSLPADDPHMRAAHVLGMGAAEANEWDMDGSGGRDSVMGQNAVGYLEGRDLFGTNGLCLGNSIGLPWEKPADVKRDFVFRNWAGLPVRFAWFNSYEKEVRALKGGIGSKLENLLRIKLGVNRLRAGDDNPHVFGKFSSLSDTLGWIPPLTFIGPDPIWTYMKQALKMWENRGHIQPGETSFVNFVPEPEDALELSKVFRKQWRKLLKQNAITAKN